MAAQATRRSGRIGLREVRGLGPGEVVWDAGSGAVTGFGARRQRSEAVSFIVVYRTREGRQRWHTIGRYGSPWTPEEARMEAKRLLGVVAAGGDPAGQRQADRRALTVAGLCDLYVEAMRAGRILTRRGEPKRPSTAANDQGRIERHIKPLVGHLPAGSLRPQDVEDFMHRVAEGATAATVKVRARGVARVTGGRATASRTVVLLQAIYGWGVRKGHVPTNPVQGVRRYADGRRERRLENDEYRALGLALGKAEGAGIWPAAVAAVRFLTLTGWRKSEALGLRWEEVDLDRRTARLHDTKTGFSLRPLSNAACDVVRTLARVEGNPLVFPSTRGAARINLQPHWARVAKAGGLPADVTPHVLRHSFMSLGNDLGCTEATIGMICGHKGHGGGTMTRGYIHAGDAVFGAADRIAAATRRRLAGESVAEIVEVAGAHRGAGRTHSPVHGADAVLLPCPSAPHGRLIGRRRHLGCGWMQEFDR